MQVTVKLFAQLGSAAGSSELAFELEQPCSVQELVLRLAREQGKSLRPLLLDETDQLRPGILLFVGQEQVSWGQQQSLCEGDEVFLTPPISGG